MTRRLVIIEHGAVRTDCSNKPGRSRKRSAPRSPGCLPRAESHPGLRSFVAAPRLVAALLILVALLPAMGAEPSRTIMKSESFDRDPGWEGWNNHVVPREVPAVVQDFGYETTNVAGQAAGEMGGRVNRASEPAYYADTIGTHTLDEPLKASGSFALTKSTGSSGVFFGFFRAEQPGAGGRPVCSLGMDIDGENSGARLAVRMINARNQSCGTFVTPFIPGKFRPTPIRNDGTRYAFTLEYDPAAAGGRGRFSFMLHSDAHQPDEIAGKQDLPEKYKAEALARFPHTTSFAVDLPEGFKQQGATFDHFGLMNLMKAGGAMAIHFDDLKYLDRAQDFSADPHWDASGNRKTYRATDVGGAHNFGFSAETNHAGGANAGEVGGTFWRNDHWGYYADKVGDLTFDDRLEARGRVVLAVGAPDSDMCFGWFGDGGKKGESPDKAGPFIGIHVGGPTRVGHYFLPAFTPSADVRAMPKQGPVLTPAKSYEWSIVYDPAGAGGKGTVTAKLGEESVTLELRAGQKALAKDAKLDHFGVLAIGPGGQIVKVYLDDLQYTAAR
jgi:hypothetical protein